MLIDATAVPADRGGVGRYVDCLVAALEADGAAPVVVCQPRDAQLYAALAPHADVLPAMQRLVTRTARLTWEQTTLPWLIRRARVDVLHCPHYTMPLASPTATVVTLHDATFFTDPGVHSPVKARFFRAWTQTSLRRADVCVVPSASTARELGRVTGADVDALHVVHHGVDAARFHPPSPEEKLLDDPARRAELSAAAQRRAKDFSWAASATSHREAYSHAAVARRSR